MGDAEAKRLREELVDIRDRSTYVLGHLGAHFAVAGLRLSIPFLPFGSVLRGSWVLGARAVETVRGRWERARVHSVPVMLLALVPFLGYLAYTMPLRRVHPQAGWLYANHVMVLRSGRTLDGLVEARPVLRSVVERITGTRPESG